MPLGQKAKGRLGTALGVTGGIVSAVGMFPGAGILGGALSLGGSAMKPQAATKEDIKKLQQAIAAIGGSGDSRTEQLLEEQLAEMVRQEEGSRRDKMEMQAELREQHGKVEISLGTIKDVAIATYKIAENLRFKASSEVRKLRDT